MKGEGFIVTVWAQVLIPTRFQAGQKPTAAVTIIMAPTRYSRVDTRLDTGAK
jgi:hypothetical protein